LVVPISTHFLIVSQLRVIFSLSFVISSISLPFLCLPPSPPSHPTTPPSKKLLKLLISVLLLKISRQKKTTKKNSERKKCCGIVEFDLKQLKKWIKPPLQKKAKNQQKYKNTKEKKQEKNQFKQQQQKKWRHGRWRRCFFFYPSLFFSLRWWMTCSFFSTHPVLSIDVQFFLMFYLFFFVVGLLFFMAADSRPIFPLYFLARFRTLLISLYLTFHIKIGTRNDNNINLTKPKFLTKYNSCCGTGTTITSRNNSSSSNNNNKI